MIVLKIKIETFQKIHFRQIFFLCWFILIYLLNDGPKIEHIYLYYKLVEAQKICLKTQKSKNLFYFNTEKICMFD